jgi:hypothetical protein
MLPKLIHNPVPAEFSVRALEPLATIKGVHTFRAFAVSFWIKMDYCLLNGSPVKLHIVTITGGLTTFSIVLIDSILYARCDGKAME